MAHYSFTELTNSNLRAKLLNKCLIEVFESLNSEGFLTSLKYSNFFVCMRMR